MVTIKELRAYKKSAEFQDFLNKFQQDKGFEVILREINTVFKDDDDMHSDNILTDNIKLSSVEFENIKNEIDTNAESFFMYYKKFLFLYADENLVNELDDEDDYEIETYDDEDIESYPSIITSNTLIGIMIDFYLLKNNQNNLFDYYKKLRIPNSKKHAKAIIDIYNDVFG